jgi:IS30 family transposase
MKRITSEKRHTIDCLLRQHKKPSEIARILGRSTSTITREIARNQDQRSKQYRFELADKKAIDRKLSKPTRSIIDEEIIARVESRLADKLSPEQIVGEANLEGIEFVSHEWIYQYIWKDKKQGGILYTHLRNQSKHLQDMKKSQQHWVLTFTLPYHSWGRSANENLDGLIRQYIPKNTNILELDKTYIAEEEKALNDRPRKRYGYKSPSIIHPQLTKMKKVALAS